MVHRDARYVAAAVQGIVGWEWLVSGTNKVLAGSFPSGLAGTLRASFATNPNGWYVAFLRGVILPHSVVFGYLIETAEVLTGLALLAGALVLLGGVPQHDEPQYRLAHIQVLAAALAAAGCLVLCVNFHFFMGDGLLPGLNPGGAFGEGIDLDTLMPPLALLLLLVNLYVLADMSGKPAFSNSRRLLQQVRNRHLASHIGIHLSADTQKKQMAQRETSAL